MKEISKRIVFGALYIAVMVTGTVVYPMVYPALCLLVAGGAMSEFFRMSMGESLYKEERIVATVTVATLFMTLFFSRMGIIGESWVTVSLLPAAILICSPIFRKDHTDISNMAYIFAAMGYIGLPIALSPLMVIRNGEFDGVLMLSLFIIIWSTDVGAYILGTALGQKPTSKKLAPAISPKKSWWGFAGAIITGVAAALVLKTAGWLELSLWQTVVLGVILSVGAVAGDLVESMWKRFFGVKDSGNAIPGHGGFYDRFDSALVAIPLAAVFLSLL